MKIEIKLQNYLAKALEPQTIKNPSREIDSDDDGWHGSKSFADAKRLVLCGWKGGREFMSKILTSVQFTPRPTPKLKEFYDVSGEFVDIGAYVDGVPECMVRSEYQPEQTRIVRIAYNLGASSAVSTEAMKWRGACTLALIDRLERQKMRVQLDIVYPFTTYSSDEAHCLTVQVKQPSEPVHIDTLAFLLAHPSSFRRIMFAYGENHPKLREIGFYEGGGYGLPITDTESVCKNYDLAVSGLQLTDLPKAIEQIEKMFNQVCNTNPLYKTN